MFVVHYTSLLQIITHTVYMLLHVFNIHAWLLAIYYYLLLDVCVTSTRGCYNSLCCVLQYVRGKCTTAIPRVASAAEYIEPTQGFDAHVSVIPPRAADSLQNQFDRSQVQCLLHFLARSFPGTVTALSHQLCLQPCVGAMCSWLTFMFTMHKPTRQIINF